jgi:hypothetical protein
MTAHTREQPEAQAQATLHEAVTTSRNWQERQMFCDYADPGPDEIVHADRRLAYWTVGILGTGSVVCIVFALFAFGAFAAERPAERIWVIWNETTNKQAHVHRFTGPTACNTDIGGVAKTMPDGSRISCVRLDQRKEQ